MRAALIGLGAMGRGHLDNYIRILKEGGPLQLVAICDVDPAKFENFKGQLNLEGIGDITYD
ncbi:MAG TPA: gfo/Idh/MocA family oxidoreductase, partial [Bacillota bacterium]|nr:gfo/Idh/MocA family oxidoreductase [Bacillota bacterium]